jgi:hypothetical protein
MQQRRLIWILQLSLWLYRRKFIDSDDLVTPVEQKDLELLDELDLVLIPVLSENFINVSRSGDSGT